MSEGSVIFKGSLNGLTIIMKEEEDYDSILKQIEDHPEGFSKEQSFLLNTGEKNRRTGKKAF